ncbi:MAG TPA: zf-HC2 domain-containing protein [Phycisphaerae bacterium]|nr:zf-HC2 domain-containing protein [Phycisphaerae bacterium]
MTAGVCNWVKGVLPAYLDGELKPSTAAAVRRHLAHCESCAARAELLEGAWNLLDEAGAPPAATGFTSRMMARIVEEKELERLEARLRPHRLRRQILAAVTGLAAGLLVWFAGTRWVSLPPEPASPIEREISRHLTFLEDAELLDEVGLVEAMERLASAPRPQEGI